MAIKEEGLIGWCLASFMTSLSSAADLDCVLVAEAVLVSEFAGLWCS